MFSVQIINLSELSIYLMEIHASEQEVYASECSAIELEKGKSISHPSKKLEYFASRALKNSIFKGKELLFDSTGGPYIQGEGFLSLSHNKYFVALIHSPYFKVGIDIECIREKAVSVSARFCSDSEKTFFDETSSKEMSLLWSMKETLFKLSDRVGLDLLTDIQIVQKGTKTVGRVKFSDSIQQFELEHIEQNGNFITFNSSKGIYT